MGREGVERVVEVRGISGLVVAGGEAARREQVASGAEVDGGGEA